MGPIHLVPMISKVGGDASLYGCHRAIALMFAEQLHYHAPVPSVLVSTLLIFILHFSALITTKVLTTIGLRSRFKECLQCSDAVDWAAGRASGL